MKIRKFKKIAFILLSLSLLAASIFLYKIPVSKVSLDVGPQIEYWSNYFGLVVKVKGIGAEGEAIITESMKQNLLNIKPEEAMNLTINAMRKSNIINYEQPITLVVAVTAENSHNSTLQAARIKEMIVAKAKRLNWGGAEIKVLSLTRKQWDIAKLSDISPGRYYILHNILDNTILVDKSSFDLNKYALLSIRELLDLENKLVTQNTIQPVLTKVVVSDTSTTKPQVTPVTTKKVTPAPVKTVVKTPTSSGIDAITTASPKK